MSEERVGERLLEGAAVQRVSLGPTVLSLRARLPGETWHVLLAARRGGQIGATKERPWKSAGLPGGSAPEGEKRRFRARLEGGRVEAIGPRWICVRAGEVRLVIAPKGGEDSGFLLRALDEGEDLSSDAIGAEGAEEVLARGEAMARELGERAIEEQERALAKALSRARSRVERRIAAVRGDLARIGEAGAIAAKASLFVAAAARAPRGARAITAVDWSTGEAVEIALPVDPARPAREQIEAMFKRARRLQAGERVARERLIDAERAAARLAAIEARLGEAGAIDSPAGIEDLAREARAAAPRDFALATAGSSAARGAPGGSAPSLPYRVFRGALGARILVGRGAAHNDALTFRAAKPHDLWLHAKGWKGAHVIVPLDKNHACPSDLLIDAAHLAAHFSDAREEGVVEIQHTPRRHLRKPRGSAPGFVVVDREKVLVLRVEAERVARLLAAEEIAGG